MATGGASFSPTAGWGKLRALLNPGKHKVALEKNIRIATQANAMMVQREIRQRLQKTTSKPNAQLTILLKSSSKPLVDRGDLFQAITYDIKDAYTAFVGVMKTKGKGADAVNIAQVLHEGTTLPVTPAMRGLFFYLWKLTTGTMSRDKVTEGRLTEIFDRLPPGKIIYPLKESTTAIHIPPRPFIREVFEDKTILAKCKANWEKAVKSALEGE